MQEACTCCWHLSSPAMFLTPGSPRPHHTHRRVHVLQGMGAASPVGYRHPCSAKQKAAGWLCPCVQWLCCSQEHCRWMGSIFLPSISDARLLYFSFVFSPTLCFPMCNQMPTVMLGSTQLDHTAIRPVCCNKKLQDIFTGGCLCSFQLKYMYIYISIILHYGGLLGDIQFTGIIK